MIKPKPRFDLIPWSSLEEVADVFTFGATKYEDYGWVTKPMTEHFSALQRHLAAACKAETLDDVLDKESGCSHYAHAAARAIMLLYLDKVHHRPNKPSVEQELDAIRKEIHGPERV